MAGIPCGIGFHRGGRTDSYRGISPQALHALGIGLPPGIDRDDDRQNGHKEGDSQHLSRYVSFALILPHDFNRQYVKEGIPFYILSNLTWIGGKGCD